MQCIFCIATYISYGVFRHSLWVLGNGSTLENSGSIWQKLVIDAKSRGCFYDVQEDKKLAIAISGTLMDIGQLDTLVARSLLFREAKWKVHPL